MPTPELTPDQYSQGHEVLPSLSRNEFMARLIRARMGRNTIGAIGSGATSILGLGLVYTSSEQADSWQRLVTAGSGFALALGGAVAATTFISNIREARQELNRIDDSGQQGSNPV